MVTVTIHIIVTVMNQVFFVIRLKGNDFFTFSTWLILYHGWCYFQKSLVTKGSNPF